MDNAAAAGAAATSGAGPGSKQDHLTFFRERSASERAEVEADGSDNVNWPRPGWEVSPPFTHTSLRKFQSPTAVAKLTASTSKISSCSAEQDLLVQQVGEWAGGWVDGCGVGAGLGWREGAALG